MTDISHWVGADLGASASGDLAFVEGVLSGQQRVLRRLITNAREYIFHPDYGAGLPARIGSLLDADALAGLIRAQMALEAVVARTPPPQVEVRPTADGVAVRVQYVDAPLSRPVVLAFDVTP